MPQAPRNRVWDGGSKGKVWKVIGGSVVAVVNVASRQSQNGSVMKKMKQKASEKAQSSGNDKKKKANAMKNELRNLAFGNIKVLRLSSWY